jgi:hypothetical protein
MDLLKQFKEDIQVCEEQMEELTEMANLRPAFTGFKYYIWVGPNPASHGPRIKVVNEPGRLDPKNCFSVSISDDPAVVAGTSKIPEKQLKEIFAWVKTHKDALLAHARLEIDDDELRERIKSNAQ